MGWEIQGGNRDEGMAVEGQQEGTWQPHQGRHPIVGLW